MEEPEIDKVRKLREDISSYCTAQIKDSKTTATESEFKVEQARRDAYADIDEHFGILAENLPEEIEEEPVDLEKQKDNKFAPRVLPCSAPWFEDGEEKQKEQKEIPMPNSTELIEMWDKEEAMLKEKDFCGDEWRLAYNAFLDGFARGTCVKSEKQKEQKPIEWSEEDEDNLCRVIRVLEDNDSDWKELSSWLKSLRPQPKK